METMLDHFRNEMLLQIGRILSTTTPAFKENMQQYYDAYKNHQNQATPAERAQIEAIAETLGLK